MSRQQHTASDSSGPADSLAGARMAALLLHAMPAESRLWVLSQLPDEQSKSLQDLLSELQDLGIPADGTLLSEVLSSGATSSHHGMSRSVDVVGQRAIVEQTEPGSLWLLLRDEPVGLIAWIVVLFGEQWEDTFIEHLAPDKRGPVARLVEQYREAGWSRSVVPDQFCTHLLAMLSAKLSEFNIRWVLDQTLEFPRRRRTRKWWRPSPAVGSAASPVDRFRR